MKIVYPEGADKVVKRTVDRLNRSLYYKGQCWMYTGNCDRDGYGRTSFRGKKVRLTHLVVHLVTGAPLSSIHLVMHSCDNPGCFNPDHLAKGTQSDNIKHAVARGTVKPNSSGRVRGKFKCGHLYNIDNIYRDSKGSAHCQMCRIEARRS